VAANDFHGNRDEVSGQVSKGLISIAPSRN